MATKTWMTHAERQIRRKAIADFLAEPDKTIWDACKKFSVGSDTAYKACRAYGIFRKLGCAKHKIPTPATFRILLAMTNGASDADLVVKFQVSKQRVNQIRQAARAVGWEV